MLLLAKYNLISINMNLINIFFSKKNNFLFLIVFFVCFFTNKSFSQDIPERPSPPRLVNDFVGILDQTQNNNLENKLVQFNNSTSTQIVIVIVPDLSGTDPADYAIQLGEKWGVGQKGKDNGIVVLVKPTGGKGQKKAFISVGYGLESVIPDATARQIVDNEMISYFKNNEFYQGLDNGTTILMQLASKEFSATDYNKKVSKSALMKYSIIGILIIFVLLFIFFSKVSSAKAYAKTNNMGLWAAFWLLMASGNHSGHYNNFSSGSGGFGGWGSGSSGGGFSGFGGGSFGGGGAGGSW